MKLIDSVEVVSAERPSKPIDNLQDLVGLKVVFRHKPLGETIVEIDTGAKQETIMGTEVKEKC